MKTWRETRKTKFLGGERESFWVHYWIVEVLDTFFTRPTLTLAPEFSCRWLSESCGGDPARASAPASAVARSRTCLRHVRRQVASKRPHAKRPGRRRNRVGPPRTFLVLGGRRRTGSGPRMPGFSGYVVGTVAPKNMSREIRPSPPSDHLLAPITRFGEYRGASLRAAMGERATARRPESSAHRLLTDPRGSVGSRVR